MNFLILKNVLKNEFDVINVIILIQKQDLGTISFAVLVCPSVSEND